MKLNKTFALVALVAGSLVAGATVQAQDTPNAPKTPPPGGPPGAQGGPGMHGSSSEEQLLKELNLTDGQMTKIKAAVAEQQAKAKALRENTSLTQEEKRAKANEIGKAFIAKFKEILTPEQFEKWQKQMQQMQQQMQQQQQQQRPHPPKGGGDKPSAGGDNATK